MDAGRRQRQLDGGHGVSVTRYFDTHAHFAAGPAIAGQIARARAAGVTRIVAVGGSPQLNAGARAAAAAAPGHVLPAFGLDRDQAGGDDDQAAALENLFAAGAAPAPAAVGEIGLDYCRSAVARERQRLLMERQLGLAARLRLPAIIHTRAAEADTLALLRNARGEAWFREGRPGVIHCFTGDAAFAEALLALDYRLGFSGIVTFAGAAPLRKVAAAVPGERLLIETDAPYLTPVPLRGRPNEPALVVHVAAVLARERGVAPEELAALTWRNAETLFGTSRHATDAGAPAGAPAEGAEDFACPGQAEGI